VPVLVEPLVESWEPAPVSVPLGPVPPVEPELESIVPEPVEPDVPVLVP
jgi:hypothetical protein